MEFGQAAVLASAEYCTLAINTPDKLCWTQGAAASALTVPVFTSGQHAYAFKGFSSLTVEALERKGYQYTQAFTLVSILLSGIHCSNRLIFVTLKTMGFLLLKSKPLTMTKAQYKIIHGKPSTQLQLKLGTKTTRSCFNFWFQVLVPTSFLFTADTCREKHARPLTRRVWKGALWRGHRG